MTATNNNTIRERAQNVMIEHFGRIMMLHLIVAGLPIVLALFGVMLALPFAANAESGLFAVSLPLFILGLLFSMVLNTGLYNGIIHLTRGTPVKGSILFSRLRHALGSIGLPVWMTIKCAAWAIPGVIMMLWGTLLLFPSLFGSLLGSAPDAVRNVVFGCVLMVGGLILAIALVIPALLRYAMAPWFFARTPEIGVYDSVERSKVFMLGRKWRLFCLTLPYALGVLGICVLHGLLLYALQAISMLAFLFAVPVVTPGAIIGIFYLAQLSRVAMTQFFMDQLPEE